MAKQKKLNTHYVLHVKFGKQSKRHVSNRREFIIKSAKSHKSNRCEFTLLVYRNGKPIRKHISKNADYIIRIL